MAIWKSYKISEIITEIENGKFVLPAIAYSFAWSHEKIEELFDSLLKGYPFGGVVAFEEEMDSRPLFYYRSFTKTGNFADAEPQERLRDTQYCLLDGQQRLQAIYLGLNGTLNNKTLFFDLYSDFNSSFEFRFAELAAHLPAQAPVDRIVNEHLWYPAYKLLQQIQKIKDEEYLTQEVLTSLNISGYAKKTYAVRNISAFYANIYANDGLGISRITVDKSLSDIVNRRRVNEMFRRLNDGGTKLSTFELSTPPAATSTWELDSSLKETLMKYEQSNSQNLI
jgi:uncharacterized protein with ParB-like and HNH nuclease domain